MTGSNQASLAKKRLAVFLVVTFALTWGLQIPAGIVLGAFKNGELATPAILPIVALSMFFPLVGALVANRICGAEGCVDLCLRPLIRGNVRPYLMAWFMPACVTLLGGVLFFATNPQLFDPTLSSYFDNMRANLEATGGSASPSIPTQAELGQMGPMVIGTTLLASLTVAPLINAIPAIGEEAGWRGLLFPTLCELLPIRPAVIVSGIIWGLWHAPVIAMGHNYGMDYAGIPWMGIAVMTITCTAMGACLSYLRLHTGSVWPCALAHGAFNAVANTGIAFCAVGQTLAGPSPLGAVAGIPLVLLGIVCLVRMPDAGGISEDGADSVG